MSGSFVFLKMLFFGFPELRLWRVGKHAEIRVLSVFIYYNTKRKATEPKQMN